MFRYSRNVCGFIVVLFLVSILAPVAPVAAQPADCPEGLVYDAANDLCVLAENLPPDQQVIADQADDGDDQADGQQDAVDGGDDQADDNADGGDDQADTLDDAADNGGDTQGDGQQNLIDTQPVDGTAETGTVSNITLAAYPCPVGWNPEDHPMADSLQVCTTAVVPGMTYSLLYEGEEITSIGAPGQIDAARDLPGLKRSPGTWTIREMPLAGMGDPYVSCTVTRGDGSFGGAVVQVVPGGVVDFPLLDGDTLNCIFFGLPAAPANAADTGAMPIAGMRVATYTCPAGWNPAEQPYSASITTCTDPLAPEFVFSAIRNGVEVSSGTGVPNGDNGGSVDFVKGAASPLYSGIWTISGSIPPDYAAPYVTCAVAQEGANAYTGVPVTVINGSVELSIGPGADAVCQWFNLETIPRPETSRGINVVIFTCPPEWDPMGKGEDDSKAACTLPMPVPVTVRFLQGGVELDSYTSTSQSDYAYPYYDDHLPNSGKWTIQVDTPAGASSSQGFCRAYDTAGNNTSITRMNAYDGSAPITVAPNELVNCNWFTRPNQYSDILQVTAFTCPDGFDPRTAPASTRTSTCVRDSSALVQFLHNGSPLTSQQTDASGLAAVRVMAGSFRIVNEPDAGFGTPYVSCTYTSASNPQPQTIEPLIGEDQQSIGFDLVAGDRMLCDWFSIPGTIAPNDPGGNPPAGNGGDPANPPVNEPPGAGNGIVDNMLVLQLWSCPAGAATNQTYEQLLVGCPAAEAPLGITAGNTPAGLVGGQVAIWEQLPVGTLELAGAQSGSQARVVCSSSSTVDGQVVDTFAVELMVAGGVTIIEMPADGTVACDWFNWP